MKKQFLVAMALLIGLSLVVYSGVRPSTAASSGAKPSATDSPERWEYNLISLSQTDGAREEFNRLGSEGWELAGTMLGSSSGIFIFKRKWR